TNLGRSRAWLRIVLNDKVIDRAFMKLSNSALIDRYYYKFALQQDEEASNILRAILAGLTGLNFNFHIDESDYDKLPEPLRRPRIMRVPNPSSTSFQHSDGYDNLQRSAVKDQDGNGWTGIFSIVGAAADSLIL